MRLSAMLLGCVLLTPACGPAHALDGAEIDQQAVDGLYLEVTRALAEAADLRLPERVPALLLTAAEARERREAYSATLDEDAGITAAIDLAADFVFADDMLGRYLPDEKVLYVIRDVAERISRERGIPHDDLLFAVMAHELVHAYDDQVYQAIPQPKDLLEVMANGSRLPEIQARMSFVEGRATWAAELACEYAGRKPLEMSTIDEVRDAEIMRTRDGDGAAVRVGIGMVNVLARAKLVQYVQGREFARAAWKFGGEKFMGQVYEHMPMSLAELQDFERFKQRWAREEEADLEQRAADGPPDVDEAGGSS